MKSLFLLISLLLCLGLSSQSANAWDFRKPLAGWDTTEKALLATFGVLHTVDMFQTSYIFKHDDDYNEINPMIDGLVDEYGTEILPVWFIGTFLLDYAVAEMLPHTYRKVWLGASAALSVVGVVNNRSIGIGMRFKF